MYSIENDTEAIAQISALPAETLKAYAELMALLELAPWSGDAYNRERPDANMRAHPFGEHDRGLAIYLVLEDQRRVIILRVLWVS